MSVQRWGYDQSSTALPTEVSGSAMLIPPMLHESRQQKPSPQKNKWFTGSAQTYMQDNKKKLVVGFELGQLQSLGVWSSPKHCQRRDKYMGEELWPALNLPPRFLCFRQASTICCTRAWSPLYICMTGRPMPRQSGHLQESSFPLWRPGLVMPRPCHTDCSLRQGERLRKKQKR